MESVFPKYNEEQMGVLDKENLLFSSYPNEERPTYESQAKQKMNHYNDLISKTVNDYIVNIKKLYDSLIEYKLNLSSYDTYDNYKYDLLQVDTSIRSLTTLSYEIQNETMKLNKNMESTKTSISDEENKHGKMMGVYLDDKKVINSSTIMINNAVDSYKSQYISNCIMFVGIIIISIYLVKVFKR
jgi:hypothetical protein